MNHDNLLCILKGIDGSPLKEYFTMMFLLRCARRGDPIPEPLMPCLDAMAAAYEKALGQNVRGHKTKIRRNDIIRDVHLARLMDGKTLDDAVSYIAPFYDVEKSSVRRWYNSADANDTKKSADSSWLIHRVANGDNDAVIELVAKLGVATE